MRYVNNVFANAPRNDSSPIYGVILAGGEGQRLWPISTKKFPKYCLSIGCGRKSLIRQAYDRMVKITAKNRLFVVTQEAQVQAVRKQLPSLGRGNLIVEPFGRNTAAAVGLAAVVIGRVSPDAVMVFVHADQFVRNEDVFCRDINKAIRFARSNNSLVTVGVKPSYPATGFGYIKPAVTPRRCKHLRGVDGYERGTTKRSRRNIYKVERFVEKPNLEKAKKYIEQGYLWNSGIFVWEITAILEAFRDCAPKLWKMLAKVDMAGGISGKSLRGLYKKIDAVSIDNAVLEKSRNVFVVPSALKWDDVGSWLSVSNVLGIDKNGNTIDANFKGIDTKDCVVVSNDKKHLVATYGLKGVVVIHSPHATLVCPRDKAEKIKELVRLLA